MKKKYFVRLLAALPRLAVGVSAIFFGVKAFENVWWSLLCIGNVWAFLLLASTYEWSVRDIARFLKDMGNDALHE
jgi:hypothetical protein